MAAHQRAISWTLSVVAVFLCSAATTNAQELTNDQIRKLPECSLSKTNDSCKFVIDRRNPVAPSTVQMYSNQTVTVIIKHPFRFERYFLDYTTGQGTVSPDVTSSIVQGLLTPLGKLVVGQLSVQEAKPLIAENPCADSAITGPNLPDPNHLTAPKYVSDTLTAFRKCAKELGTEATPLYHRLEPFIAPDSLTPNTANQAGEGELKPCITAPEDDAAGANPPPCQLQQDILAFLNVEAAMSGRITAISANKYGPEDAPAIALLANLQKLTDAVAADLQAYSQRINDLRGFQAQNSFQDCDTLIELTADEKKAKPQCVSITSKKDRERIYQNMVTRTITYSLNALNLVSYSQEAAPSQANKRLLATVVINFADTETKFPGGPHTAFRWEASAGVFFSSLAVRSFSVAPVFTNNVVTNNTVHQNILRPTVVPFAAANYRLTNDLGWTRWKSNIYLTGAVGVNPNTVSADFAVGPSISYRALLVSALCHFGHDVRLTQGFQNNQTLGPTFTGTLPTQTYWTPSFAVGVSVRVPSLTGR